MFQSIVFSGLILAITVVTGCSSNHKDKVKKVAADPTAVTQKRLDKMTANWPLTSKSAIKSLSAKYGLPSSISEEMVVWTNSTPFKRSVVYKEEVAHQFPMQHLDVLQQTINYRVPQDKVSQLSKFDGSLLIDRTKGELSARNEKEELNILSLNFADKIVRGEMKPEEARRAYAKDAEAFASGSASPLLSGFRFETQGNTSDPDSMMQSQQDMKDRSERTKFKSETVEEVIEDQQ